MCVELWRRTWRKCMVSTFTHVKKGRALRSQKCAHLVVLGDVQRRFSFLRLKETFVGRNVMLQLCTKLQHGVHAKSGVTGPAHLGLCTHVGAMLQQQPSALQLAIAHGRVQRRTATLRACHSQVARTGRRRISVSTSTGARAPCSSALGGLPQRLTAPSLPREWPAPSPMEALSLGGAILPCQTTLPPPNHG